MIVIRRSTWSRMQRAHGMSTNTFSWYRCPKRSVRPLAPCWYLSKHLLNYKPMSRVSVVAITRSPKILPDYIPRYYAVNCQTRYCFLLWNMFLLNIGYSFVTCIATNCHFPKLRPPISNRLKRSKTDDCDNFQKIVL